MSNFHNDITKNIHDFHRNLTASIHAKHQANMNRCSNISGNGVSASACAIAGGNGTTMTSTSHNGNSGFSSSHSVSSSTKNSQSSGENFKTFKLPGCFEPEDIKISCSGNHSQCIVMHFKNLQDYAFALCLFFNFGKIMQCIIHKNHQNYAIF